LDRVLYVIAPLIAGWLLDRIFGDPAEIPHPIAGFGQAISYWEKKLNRGKFVFFKGALLSLGLILLTFISTYFVLSVCGRFSIAISTLIVFFSLSGKTLVKEVREVFAATLRSIEEGRLRLSRIVGRDTSGLSEQQIRKAALETLAENLNDGVIAPLFWYLILGAPGMFAYKMVNTLDSMIGYKNERYLLFGKFAAKTDDFANYIPARLTALIMILVSGNLKSFSFVKKYGNCHTSPNSGFPESALAAILNCRFGGPGYYFGKLSDKPFIGDNEKHFNDNDLKKAVSINIRAEVAMGFIIVVINLICVQYV